MGGAIFDSRGMIGWIYVEFYMTLLKIKYASFGSDDFREEDFFLYFHYKLSLWPIMTPLGRGVYGHQRYG